MVRKLGKIIGLALTALSWCSNSHAQEIQVTIGTSTMKLRPISPTGTTHKEWQPVQDKPWDKDVTGLLDVAATILNAFGQRSARNSAVEDGYEKARTAFRLDPTKQFFGYDLEQYVTGHGDTPFTASEYVVHELRGSTVDEIIYSRLYRDPEVKADKRWETRALVIVPRGDHDGVGDAHSVSRSEVEHIQALASNPQSGDSFRQEMEMRLEAGDKFSESQLSMRGKIQELTNKAENEKAHADAQFARAENIDDQAGREAERKAAADAAAAAEAAKKEAARIEEERKKQEDEYRAEKQRQDDQKAEADRMKELEHKKKREPSDQKEYDDLISKADRIGHTAVVVPCGEGNQSRSCQDTGQPAPCAVCNTIGDFRSPYFVGNYELVPSPAGSVDVYQFGKSKPVFRITGVPDLSSLNFNQRYVPIPAPY
ncbi:hypothetical protein [Rhizobium esperanzae]|uniref:hypothetical protein n=1 Tax=Rhizobium esperanzae TaxID=1967781 RepID=UPI0011316FDE|nr:hypothetical protein [Rhizobium esperanzae]